MQGLLVSPLVVTKRVKRSATPLPLLTPPSIDRPPPRFAMTPFAPTADSQAALATVHDSLSKLRDALRECVVLQAHHALPEGTPSTQAVSVKPSVALKPHSQELLVQSVVTKVSHDAIIRSVDLARRNSQSDLAMLQRLRQRHASLRYERALLEREIAVERATDAPALARLPVALPAPPSAADGDEPALHAHAETLAALDAELVRRRDVRNEVEKVVVHTKRKREALAKTKDDLRALPGAVAKLRAVVEPVRKLLHVGEDVAVNPAELVQIRTLAPPLYVLAREAFAFRAMFPGTIEVATAMESGKEAGLYRVHSRRVVIDVRYGASSGARGAMLQVQFRYHPELRIVTVLSRLVEGEDAPDPLEGKGLQLLFPYDVGESSPNPCNAHLEGGSFKFDASKADGARPYVWANLLCGLPCLERFAPVNDITGAGWPAQAASHEEHVRFKEVVSALHAKLGMELALKRQTEILAKKRLPVKAVELGFAEEPRACVDDFVQLATGDWETVEGLGVDGVNVVFKEVWCMAARKDEVKVNCLVGIAPNYPTGSPVFRLRCESRTGVMSEQDVMELEHRVNAYAMDGELERRRELLLTGQILALLEGMDRIVPDREEPVPMASPRRGGERSGKGKLPASLARLLT